MDSVNVCFRPIADLLADDTLEAIRTSGSGRTKMLILLAIQVMTTQLPSPEAMSLGRALVEQSSIEDAVKATQDDELAALRSDPQVKAMTDQQQHALMETGNKIAARTRALILDGVTVSYARNLSIEDLRALVAAGNRPEAARLKALRPRVLLMIGLLSGFTSLKTQTAAQYCSEVKLLCGRHFEP
jgi:hypothetical protein